MKLNATVDFQEWTYFQTPVRTAHDRLLYCLWSVLGQVYFPLVAFLVSFRHKHPWKSNSARTFVHKAHWKSQDGLAKLNGSDVYEIEPMKNRRWKVRGCWWWSRWRGYIRRGYLHNVENILFGKAFQIHRWSLTKVRSTRKTISCLTTHALRWFRDSNAAVYTLVTK